jgi:predicted transcriptional regulator
MTSTKVNLRTGSTDDFFHRIRERAKKLDSGETLPAEITISFEDPAELLKILSSERLRLLRQVKGAAVQVSALATGLERDVRAVSRDIALLEKAGLLRTRYQTNPGHGRMKVVESVAREYRLLANL